MEVIGYGLLFISGLFIGSFLNVVADRVPFGKKILTGRSRCDFCKRNLMPKDLIPLLSFISQKARCAYCNEKLSYYYPISELITGISFVFAAFYTGIFTSQASWVGFVYLIVVFSFYIVIFLADVKYKIIPNKVVFSAILFVLLFLLSSTGYSVLSSYLLLKEDSFGRYLLESGYWGVQVVRVLMDVGVTIGSSFLVSVFFYILILITKGRGMGGGDVKLGFLVGLFNGFPLNVVGIFLGFLFGALFSLVLVLLKRKGMKDTIPFGPFLILGSITAFVFGQALMDWYLGFL